MKTNYLRIVVKKIGMNTFFDNKGNAMPVTFLQVDNPAIIDQSQNKSDSDYITLRLGFFKKSKGLTRSQLKFFQNLKIDSKQFILESKVNKQYLPVVSHITKDITILKDALIDVSGKTKGKGFAGGMKKWNFGGLPASHGVSVSHRAIGSCGQRSAPGKVMKGKKMPGHLGNINVYHKSLRILDVDKNLQLLAVHGSTPGNNNSFCTIHLNLNAINLK